MEKNRLKDQTHTRKDVFVFAVDEKDLPPTNAADRSKLNKQYMVTITFDNGKFANVTHKFPANRDQRAIYRIFADINAKIDEISEKMDKDASIQEMIKTQEIEEKRSPGRKLGKIAVKNSKAVINDDVLIVDNRQRCALCGKYDCFESCDDDVPF